MKINKYNNFRNISGSVLKELRLKANLSQQDLAEKLQLLGVELTSKEISKIENDNRLVQDFNSSYLFTFCVVVFAKGLLVILIFLICLNIGNSLLISFISFQMIS